MNIGSYEEIVFMRNDNNEIEALKLKLVVRGQKPTWVIKASDFDLDMVVYSKMRVNNVFSINKEDMLGAFLGGKCVSVARILQQQQQLLVHVHDQSYSTLDIKNDPIEFRIWQASTLGKTFSATTSRLIYFINHAVNGTVNAPLIFDGGNQVFQNIPLIKLELDLLQPAHPCRAATSQRYAQWCVDGKKPD